MAIEINKILTSDLTIHLEPQEVQYIQIHGNISTCIMSTIIEASGSYTIKATIDSTETFELPATVDSTITWENIRILGVEYTTLITNIVSTFFNSPNVLRIENTSTGTQLLSVSIRGNR